MRPARRSWRRRAGPPRLALGIRDPYRFPLEIGAEAHASNQRNLKALQHANKYGLLPGLASTAWQTGDTGKAEVIDLFHQVAAADARGGSAHARNLEDRFLPMIPKEDKALFRELRARKNEKPSATNADEVRVAETATERAFKDAGKTIGKALGLKERPKPKEPTAIERLQNQLETLIKRQNEIDAEIKKMRKNLVPSNRRKLGEVLRKLSRDRENHRDYYEAFRRVPPLPRREGSPPEMEVPDSMLESDVVQESIISDIQNALKEHAKNQKQIDESNAELKKLRTR